MVAGTQQTRPRVGPLDAIQPVVVCVDDDDSVLSSLRRALRPEACDVLVTDDPGEALLWLEDRPVAVVIADLRMPGMSGLELLQSARTLSPGIGCLLLTGYPEDESARECRERLLTKPWDDDEVRRTVRSMISQRLSRTAPALRELAEPAVTLDCARARVDAVLKAIYERVAPIPASHRYGVVLILENLPLLDGPIESLLAGIEKIAADWSTPFFLLERFGAARAHLSNLLSPHLTAVGPEVGPGGERRFVIVDPEPDWSAFIRRTVDALGHLCSSYASVAEARIRSGPETFDVAMLEVDQLGALDLAADWGLGRARPVIATCTRTSPADLPSFKAAKKSCHLTKPVRFRDLLGVLRWAL